MQSVRRFLGPNHQESSADGVGAAPFVCETCGRRFRLPMHLGRHRKAKHTATVAA
jgi:hypothetical protein